MPNAGRHSARKAAPPCIAYQPARPPPVPAANHASIPRASHGVASPKPAMPASISANARRARPGEQRRASPAPARLPAPSPAMKAATVMTTPKMLTPNNSDSMRVHSTSQASAVAPEAA